MPKLSWRLVLRVIALLALIASLIWLVVQPSFEPLIGLLSAIATLISLFFVDRGESSVALTSKGASLVQTLRPHKGWVYSIDWSPDGKFLAVASSNVIELWQATDEWKLLRILEGHSSYIYDVAWSPDGQMIASASDDETARIWLASDGKLIHILPEAEGHAVYKVAWHPYGYELLSVSQTKVQVWRIPDGDLLHTWRGRIEIKDTGEVEIKPYAYLKAVAWDPDAILLAIGGSASDTSQCSINVMCFDQGAPAAPVLPQYNHVRDLSYSPDGKIIAVASQDAVFLCRSFSGTLVHTLKGHTGEVYSVAWHPDGQTIATASEDTTVRVWNAASGKLMYTLKGHLRRVTCVAYRPDGTLLASGGVDKTVRLWQVC